MRKTMFPIALAICGLANAAEQGNSLDTVVVTGSRISYRDLQDTPAISIIRKGDYLLQQITIINDSRSEDSRKQEIYATIDRMLAQAGSRYQILSGEEYRIALDKSTSHVELQIDTKRPDVSHVDLYVRVSVDGDASAGDASIQSLRGFIKAAAKVGRTEIDMTAETAIGMNKPERYRHDLISAIAEDSHLVGAELGNDCRIELTGLNDRIEWQRVSAVELLLYIPYTMKVTGCSSPPAKS
jgi:uncharacterized lipoprotein YehR (DUF1307 family)